MNILLIDDHLLFAKSLEITLKEYDFIDKFITINEVDNIYKIIEEQRPDIVLLDINLSNISSEDGIFIAENILNMIPSQKIVMLTGYDLPVYKMKSKKIGASGYINKNISPADLAKLLQKIYNDYEIFEVADLYNFETLTSSEIEILQLVGKGYRRDTISKYLNISKRTVSNHLQNIFQKLDVNSSIEAVSKGIELGYINPLGM